MIGEGSEDAVCGRWVGESWREEFGDLEAGVCGDSRG
jgi:hypothetical protein